MAEPPEYDRYPKPPSDWTQEELDRYLGSIRTFPPPPARFDPLRATPRELARYGFPRRPDISANPDLAAAWTRAFSRPVRPVTAELEIDPVLNEAAQRHGRWSREGQFKPQNWGGIVARTSAFGFSPPEPAIAVSADWTVPAMEPDFENTSPMTVGFWVGIDGFGGVGGNQVLQAGTAATVAGDKIDYWSWYEWFPDPYIKFTNLPVEPGHLVTTVVCAAASGQGYVGMINRSTGAATSVDIPPPANIASMGTTVEWAVEGISADLPNFHLAGFHNCSAGTEHNKIDLSHPTHTEIVGQTDNLTDSIVWMPNHVLVFWLGIR